MNITGFTPLNSQNCVLNDSRIDLWQFSLAKESYSSEQLLNPDEKARANRFYFNKHKRRFANSRAALRVILARYLNVDPENLGYTYNAHGKPSVINSQKLQFNLSHTGDWALLAIGRGFPLGVDIEEYSARPYEGIAKDLFSEEEFNRLKQAPHSLKPALFFHIWTQKEAFIKSNGLGLSYPTKEFTVPTTLPSKQLVDDPLHNTTWQLRSFMPKVACNAALCHHPTVREIRYGLVELERSTKLVF